MSLPLVSTLRVGCSPIHAEMLRTAHAERAGCHLRCRADSLPILLRPAAHYWASFLEPTRTLAALVRRTHSTAEAGNSSR